MVSDLKQACSSPGFEDEIGEGPRLALPSPLIRRPLPPRGGLLSVAKELGPAAPKLQHLICEKIDTFFVEKPHLNSSPPSLFRKKEGSLETTVEAEGPKPLPPFGFIIATWKGKTMRCLIIRSNLNQYYIRLSPHHANISTKYPSSA